jgi:hypothetical protein
MTWSILVIFSIWYFVFEILYFIQDTDAGISDHPQNYELYLCAGFFATMFVLSVGIQQMGMYSSILGSKVKAALTTAIYKKMISRDEYGSKANVVSLIAKDVEKLAEACLSLQFLWSGIFETVCVLVLVFTLLGATILPGIGLMLFFLPLQYVLGLFVAYRKKNLGVVSSKRISLMEEIMRGIKLIKIYGWEASFAKNLNDIRGSLGFCTIFAALFSKLWRVNRVSLHFVSVTFRLGILFYRKSTSLPLLFANFMECS